MANLTITAADVRPVQILEQETLPAGEAITAGQLVKANTSARAMKTNATEELHTFGIALLSVAANFPVTWVRKGLIFLGTALDSMDYGAPVYASETDGALADADPGENEVQTLTISGSPTGGTFTVTFDGQTTSAVAYNASAATLQAALEALSTIGANNVIVSGSAGGPYTITFVQDLGKQNVSLMTADGTSLTGGTTPDAAVALTNAGVQSVIVGHVEAIAAATTPLKALRIG